MKKHKKQRTHYKVVISSSKRYAKYIVPHLKKEHPHTRGRIKIIKYRR